MSALDNLTREMLGSNQTYIILGANSPLLNLPALPPNWEKKWRHKFFRHREMKRRRKHGRR